MALLWLCKAVYITYVAPALVPTGPAKGARKGTSCVQNIPVFKDKAEANNPFDDDDDDGDDD